MGGELLSDTGLWALTGDGSDLGHTILLDAGSAVGGKFVKALTENYGEVLGDASEQSIGNAFGRDVTEIGNVCR